MTPNDWPDVLEQLKQVTIFDYFKNRSMPGFVEPLVGELVRSFAISPPDKQRNLLTEISREVSSILGWYARKLAGRAVREGSTEDLRNGLIALSISASKGDLRDVMAPLALLHNSALLLHQDPVPLFEGALRMTTPSAADGFTSFLDRPVDQKSINIFGFSEGAGPHGFDYLPLLPEYGGPTPF